MIYLLARVRAKRKERSDDLDDGTQIDEPDTAFLRGDLRGLCTGAKAWGSAFLTKRERSDKYARAGGPELP